jgi:phage terminase large subunit-like protein
MPWQQYVADVLGEVDPDTGQLWYTEGDISLMRQVGKTTLTLAKSTHRCTATGFFGPRQQLVYTAQTRNKAREKFVEDYAPTLAASRAFASRVSSSWATGNEHLRFRNGSRFGIEATTEKAGHGGTLDEAYIDEAFAHIDNRVEQSFKPPMITRRNRQLIVESAAGWLDTSPYWWGKVRLGRELVSSGARSRTAYFEWSAPEGADPGAPATWWACIPSLGFTLTEDAVASEFESMSARGDAGLADFCRAYLNMWLPKPREADASWLVVSEAAWGALLDAGSEIPVRGRVVYALDVAPDRESAAVGVAGARADGLAHVEVADWRPGTSWVVEWFTSRGIREVVVDGKGAAGFAQDLADAGVEVVEAGPVEMATACGRFYDGCVARSLRRRAQPVLDDALEGAARRPLAGSWAWDKVRSGVDLTALVSVTLAYWRHLELARPAQTSAYEGRGLVAL